MEIKKLEENHVKEALDLVWKVFCEFEAPVYSQEGIDEFRNFLNNKEQISQLQIYGAFDKQKIVGVIAMRKKHISLFFVKKEKHRQGIGKALLKYVFEHIDDLNKGDNSENMITVNSSPYAVDIYKKLNFIPSDVEQITNGIRYTAMVYKGIV